MGRKMEKIKQLVLDYEKTRENDEIIHISERCYGYKNEEKRREIRNKYIKLLPNDKQLAIFLHSKLCHCDHTDQCGFFYEINGLEDNWNGYGHKEYLEKAKKVLKVCSDLQLLEKIFEAAI